MILGSAQATKQTYWAPLNNSTISGLNANEETFEKNAKNQHYKLEPHDDRSLYQHSACFWISVNFCEMCKGESRPISLLENRAYYLNCFVET